MFLGYQNNIITFVADTREQLENLPCVVFDEIVETDEQYFLHEGQYVTEIPQLTRQQVQQVQQARADLYAKQVDPLVSEYSRKKIFNLFADGEEQLLLQQIQQNVDQIKANNPYPEE